MRNLLFSPLVLVLISGIAYGRDDIRGISPGLNSSDALKHISAQGYKCRHTDDLSYIECTNGLREHSDIDWEMLRIFSIADRTNKIEFRFRSGNDFRALVDEVSSQFGGKPYEIGFLDVARWRLHDGTALVFRQLGDAGILELQNPDLENRLRELQYQARRNINPHPKF